MRVRVLAMLATVFAIAACNDAQSPMGLGSTGEPPAIGAAAHFAKGDDGKGNYECRDNHHDRHGHYSHHGSKSGHHHGTCGHSSGKPAPKDDGRDGHDCKKDDSPGTGNISGTVKNNAQVVSGYPIFLLSPNGTTVVATTSTNTSGAYTFSGVKVGAYLICEANPFVPEWEMLAETTPGTGPSCSQPTYGPVGYTVNVTKGGTASGNDFANFGLE